MSLNISTNTRWVILASIGAVVLLASMRMVSSTINQFQPEPTATPPPLNLLPTRQHFCQQYRFVHFVEEYTT